MFQKCSDKKKFGLWGFQDFVSIFCLTVPENFGEEHFCVALMFWYQIFMDNRGIRILSIVLSHSALKLRGGTLMCFRNVLVSKIFWVIGVSGFCLFFCLTLPKNFVGEPFFVSEFFGHRKTLCTIVISRFFVENFLSHSAAKFRGGTVQCFRKFWVSKNFMHKKGLSLISVEFFVSQCSILRGGTLSCFRTVLVSKNFLDSRGIRILSIFFRLTVPKNFLGELLCVSELFWYQKNFG